MLLRLSTIALLVCLWAPLLAQTPNDSRTSPGAQPIPQAKPPAQPPATSHITGSVFCDDTRRPARGAMVMAFLIPENGPMQPNFGPMARVATNGTYSINHLRAGNYAVIALLPGYLSPLDEIPVDTAINGGESQLMEILKRNGVVSVRDNESGHMDLTLKRGGILSGRVTYSDGAPATQTLINIEDVNAKEKPKPAPNPNGDQDIGIAPSMSAGTLFRSFVLHQSQGTNDQGEFRIAGVPPGTYRVSAALPSPDSNADGEAAGILFGIVGDARALHVYSDSTLHKSAAKTYDVRAGDNITDIDITIPLDIFHSVQGTLTSADGRPVLAGSLNLTDTSDDSFVLHTVPARDGSFVFPEVPNGTYKLAISGAKLGTLPDGFAEGIPVQPALLRNIESLLDKTTTVLVKDADVTDLNIQLQNSPPSPNQPAGTPTPASPTQ